MTTPPPRWLGSPAQIVFENDDIRVTFKPGGSDVLLVTFGDAGTLASGTSFFAEPVVAKYGINCLGFMAKAANWYPVPSMQAAQRACAFTLAAFDLRLGYGSSMGGYAAIKHSALLALDHVAAFCPQWSIDPAECGAVESGYANYFRPEMAGMSIRPADVAGRINIFFDPRQQADAFHCSRLSQLSPDVSVCRVHHAGHQVAPVLKGSALAVAIFTACITDNAALYRVINPARRASFHRRRQLLAAAASRHPVLTFRAAAQLAREGQVAVLDGPRCVLKLLPALVACGRRDLARSLIGMLIESADELRARVLREDAAADWDGVKQPRATLLTAHGTGLFYSALGGCLTHLALPLAPVQRLGLRSVFVHSTGVLATGLDGELFACDGFNDTDTRLVPIAADLPPTCFRAEAADGETVALSAAGLYASAHPDGLVWRTALQKQRWERFQPLNGPTVAKP